MGINPKVSSTLNLRIKMKKNVIAVTVLFCLAPILCLQAPAVAQVNQNIAPSEPTANPVPSQLPTPAVQPPAVPAPLAKPEIGKNTIGPSISLGGGGAAIGVDSRFGISENLSLRPFIYFGNGVWLRARTRTFWL